MKTLVYHSGALGDFLSILPLLRIWREYTNSQIVLLGRPEYGVLAQTSGLIDELHSIDNKDSLVFFSEQAPLEIKERLSVYTHCMLFAKSDSHLVINFKKYFPGTLLVQDPFPQTRMHIIEYHLQLIKESGFLHYLSPAISVLEPVVDNQLCVPGSVVIHPGSGSRKKNWAFSNYLQVAEKIRSRGLPIIWICGPAEDHFAFPTSDTVYNNRPLSDLVTLLGQSTLFIGNDSGITHLAAASGCAVIAIFGPSDPVVWAPRGEKLISVVYKELSCSPCHLLHLSPTDSCSFECLNQISSNEIVLLVDEHLGNVDRMKNAE
jgi:heptosyltransferase III